MQTAFVNTEQNFSKSKGLNLQKFKIFQLHCINNKNEWTTCVVYAERWPEIFVLALSKMPGWECRIHRVSHCLWLRFWCFPCLCLARCSRRSSMNFNFNKVIIWNIAMVIKLTFQISSSLFLSQFSAADCVVHFSALWYMISCSDFKAAKDTSPFLLKAAFCMNSKINDQARSKSPSCCNKSRFVLKTCRVQRGD